MSDKHRVFYNHSRHTLKINNLKAPVDVLAFDGVEGLSQTFLYTIEFTSAEQDISVEQVLNQRAWFSLHAPPDKDVLFSGLIKNGQHSVWNLHLPCDELHVTTSYYTYGSSEYPIKTPLNLPEAHSCPQ